MKNLTPRTVAGMPTSAAAIGMSGKAAGCTDAHSTIPPAPRHHEPKPLPFDPARLDGLSERLITSHWENNYKGSVNALNMIHQRLVAAMADRDFPPLIYGDIKREQLHRTGSIVLHELYFGNLGGNGQTGGDVQRAIVAAFGSFRAWEREFRLTAMSLAGGSGWVVLALNTHTGDLVNYWMWDHMHAPASGIPLLALDMYEHSYHIDYGTAAARYIDAFLRNVNWEEVDCRYALARRIISLGTDPADHCHVSAD